MDDVPTQTVKLTGENGTTIVHLLSAENPWWQTDWIGALLVPVALFLIGLWLDRRAARRQEKSDERQLQETERKDLSDKKKLQTSQVIGILAKLSEIGQLLWYVVQRRDSAWINSLADPIRAPRDVAFGEEEMEICNAKRIELTVSLNVQLMLLAAAAHNIPQHELVVRAAKTMITACDNNSRPPVKSLADLVRPTFDDLNSQIGTLARSLIAEQKSSA